MEPNQKKKWGDLPAFNKFAIIFACCAFLLLGGLLIFGGSSGSSMPKDALAYEKAKEFVSRGLKSPSTAKYPVDFKAEISPSDSVYTVRSYVDAVNSFNVPIRSNWAVIMKYTKDGNWRLLDIKLK